MLVHAQAVFHQFRRSSDELVALRSGGYQEHKGNQHCAKES